MSKLLENADLTDLLLGLLLTLVALGLRWLAKKAKFNEAQTEAMEQILLATQDVRSSYVEALRQANDDGVVTEEEKQKAIELAKALLLARVGPEAKKVVLSWSEERLRGLIQLALDKVKKPD